MKRSIKAAAVLATLSSMCFVAVASAEEVLNSNLPAVVVEGVRDTLPDVYAGGQVARGARIGVLGNRDFMDTPMSINAYTAEGIKNSIAKTVAEAAMADPAIRFQYPAGGLIENYRIRNYTYNANNMTINGLMGLAPYGTAPTEMVERVEIQRGPNAFANGMNPGGEVAGNINLVLKRAEYEPTRSITVDYTNKSQIGGHIDIGERFGSEKQWGVRFNGAYRDGDVTIDDQSQKRKLTSIAIDHTKGKSRTTLDAYYAKDSFDGAAPSVYQVTGAIPKPVSGGNSVKGLYGSMENKGIFAHTDYSFTKDLSAYVSYGKSWADYEGFIGGANMLATDGLTGLGRLYISNDKLYVDKTAWETGVRANFKTGNINHEAVLGLSRVSLETGNNNGNYLMLPGVSIYDMKYDLSTRPTLDKNTSKLQSVDLQSIMIADTMKFAGDKIQFTAGARKQSVHQKAFSGNVVSSDYDESKVTPMLSLLVKPWDNKVSIYANYSEGLKAGNIVPNNAIYRNKNQVFAPYVSKQAEIGVKLDNKNIANTFSLYQIKQVNTYQEIHSDGTRTFHADGEQRNRGIEWMTFGKVTDRLRVLGGICYGDAKVTRAAANVGKLAWGSPKWMGTFGFEYDATKDLTLSTRVIYTGRQYANSANTLELPSSARVDLGARYTVNMGKTPVTFRAVCENLFNKEYWAGCRSDSVLFNGSGRTFKLTATFDL